jgi:hypothetical protein
MANGGTLREVVRQMVEKYHIQQQLTYLAAASCLGFSSIDANQRSATSSNAERLMRYPGP